MLVWVTCVIYCFRFCADWSRKRKNICLIFFLNWPHSGVGLMEDPCSCGSTDVCSFVVFIFNKPKSQPNLQEQWPGQAQLLFKNPIPPNFGLKENLNKPSFKMESHGNPPVSTWCHLDWGGFSPGPLDTNELCVDSAKEGNILHSNQQTSEHLPGNSCVKDL